MPPTTSGEEKIDPTPNCRTVATIGTSRQLDQKSSGPLNWRSAVSTQPSLRFDASA